MIHLLFTTIQIMGLTFAIGFLVALIIKGIAVWANYLDYHHSSEEEMESYGKIYKLRVKLCELLGLVIPDGIEKIDDERSEFMQGVNTDMLKKNPTGYYHGVSHGASEFELNDYFYPRDTKLVYLQKKDQMENKPSSGDTSDK